MQRRDYVRIARVFAEKRETVKADPDRYEVWANLVIAMCDSLANENPRFDRLLFQYACVGHRSEVSDTLAGMHGWNETVGLD